MARPETPLDLKASLSGFNTYAQRSSPEAFIKSYLKRFPDRRFWLEVHLPEALEIAGELISRKPDLKPPVKPSRPWKGNPKQPTLSRIISKKPPKVEDNAWIPRGQYIPDNPNPRSSYRREATNIARAMRERLES